MQGIDEAAAAAVELAQVLAEVEVVSGRLGRELASRVLRGHFRGAPSETLQEVCLVLEDAARVVEACADLLDHGYDEQTVLDALGRVTP